MAHVYSGGLTSTNSPFAQTWKRCQIQDSLVYFNIEIYIQEPQRFPVDYKLEEFRDYVRLTIKPIIITIIDSRVVWMISDPASFYTSDSEPL